MPLAPRRIFTPPTKRFWKDGLHAGGKEESERRQLQAPLNPYNTEEFQRESDTNGPNADLSDGLSHFTVCSADLNLSRRRSPGGALVLGAPQVADSVLAPSLFFVVIAPVCKTQMQKQGLTGLSRESWLSSFSIILSTNKVLRTAASAVCVLLCNRHTCGGCSVKTPT